MDGQDDDSDDDCIVLLVSNSVWVLRERLCFDF